MIKLIALDIDGTTLLPNGTISPAVVKAIGQARQKGVNVILASGRWHSAMTDFYPIIGCSGPQVNSNGATIITTEGELIASCPMPLSDSFKLIAELDSLKIPYGVCDHYNMYSTSYSKKIDEVYNHFCLTQDDMSSLKAITKLTINSYETPKYNTLEFFNHLCQSYPQFTITGAQEGHLEVWFNQTHKGLAVLKVAAQQGITKDEIMAMGDGTNDVEMLKSVGLGIAMGNAAKEAKAVAKHIAPKNTEDGVAWAIEKFVQT